MKLFSRKNRGNILIGIGSVFFLLVIYDSIFSFGPRSLPGRLEKKVATFFSSAPIVSSPARETTGARQARAPGVRITVPCEGEALTDSVVRPGLSHNLWVWAVKPSARIGSTVKVEAAHAAEGAAGGFAIIAFADTDDDGEPDLEIARSDYLTVSAPGCWSSFTFSSQHKRIFVGTTWPIGNNVLVYRLNGPWPGQESKLEHLFRFSKNGGSFHRAGPAFTNLAVSFSE